MSIVSLDVYNPDLNHKIITEQTATVSATVVEFQNIARFSTIPTDVNLHVVDANIDVTNSQIIWNAAADAGTRTFATSPNFNGYEISFIDSGAPAIQSVTINVAGTTLHETASNIFFNNQSVFVNVEGLAFAPGDKLTLDVSFYPAGQSSSVPDSVLSVARLYEASLNRQPDDAGLNYWIHNNLSGESLVDISNQFLHSNEFTNNFGNANTLSNAQLVNVLYQNVLHRAGEPGGVAFWESALGHGESRADLLMAFAVSAENVANTSFLQNMAHNSVGDWLIV
jgi:hypothetical protein